MRWILAAIGIGSVMSGTAQAQDGYYGKYETPRYEIVQILGEAEVRNYAPHLMAEVAVRGDQRGALTRGFQALAGYIFGGNEGAASVSMTSPVMQSAAQIAMTSPVTQSQSNDVWTVQFMMPGAFTLDTLPTPNNAAIRFVEVPAKQMLVVTFAGRATSDVLDDRTAQIKQIADAQGLQTTGEPVFMFYDAPMTLPRARRNEVALALR